MADSTVIAPQGTQNSNYDPNAKAGEAGSLDPTLSAPATTGATSPSLIVTSSASRSNYADNVTGLNTALANTSTIPSPNQSVRYDNGNVYNQPDGKGGFYSGPVADAPGELTNMPDGNGGFYNGPAAGAPQVTAPAADGADNSNPTPNADGTIPLADGGDSTTDDSETQAVSSLPPGLASMFQQSLAAQDQNIADAKTTLATAAATMQNDPAAAQAASAISAQYDVLINAMKAKNRIILGGYTANAARSGALQYANDMTETFMSNEMDRASQRIADLVSKEQELILKSNAAYKNDDVKAFNAAQTALTKATTEKTNTLGKLLTATNNQVKAVQAQQKIDATAAKNKISADTTISAKTAPGMVAALKDKGITDPDQISQYVQEMATQLGVDPNILAGALATAQQTQAKTDSTIANQKSEIAKRNQPKTTAGAKGGTDVNYNYTADDVADAKNVLQNGGSGYAAAGSDGFSDPGAYVALMNSWIKLGGSAAGFAKVFAPKKYVNPDSYGMLPAAIQPKKAATSSDPKFPVSTPTK